MLTSDLKSDLKNKEKSISDLLRYITTRTDNNPNYSLLLGAGCSISSGIRSAQTLTSEWRRDVYLSYEENRGNEYNEHAAKDFLSKHCGGWYNPNNEYSSLFEKKYDLPRQRRMFVEQEVSNKIPSLGYAYLTKLVRHSYFNTIFTTNFDDLINEAFYQYSDQRPIVCAHDSSIGSITVTSKRPKVIKLHGDYLFDDIKSTFRETESLENNMKAKFIEFAKDYGLVVVGYGANDRSIMDVLTYLLKHDDYYKNGIYWCLRPGSKIPEELRKLLWKDRAYYVVVDGFDEFFAELNHEVFKGDLPIETSLISAKSRNLIAGFVNNDYLRKCSSPIVINDIAQLEKQSERDTLFDMLKQVDSASDSGRFTDRYSDAELILLFSVEDLMKNEQFLSAIERARQHLAANLRKDVKVKLLQLVSNAHKKLGNYEQAANTCDEMIEIDPHNSGHLIRKADLSVGWETKLALIESAIGIDPYSEYVYAEKADILIEGYKLGVSPEKDRKDEEIIKVFDKGIACDPSVSNVCWEPKFQFIQSQVTDPQRKAQMLNEIVSQLSQQNPYHPKVLRLGLKLLEPDVSTSDADKFLENVRKAKEKGRSRRLWSYDRIYITALAKFNRVNELEGQLNELATLDEYKRNADFLYEKGRLLLEKYDRLNEAIRHLEQSLDLEKNLSTIGLLAQYYGFAGKQEQRKRLIESSEAHLPKKAFLDLMHEYYRDIGDYAKAREKLVRLKASADWPDECRNDEIFLGICEGRNKEANQLAREFLDKVDFNLKYESEIVNYELSGFRMNGKVHRDRLENLYQYSKSPLTRAAVAALLNDKNRVFENIDRALQEDQSDKYVFRNWPVFSTLKSEQRFRSLYERAAAARPATAGAAVMH